MNELERIKLVLAEYLNEWDIVPTPVSKQSVPTRWGYIDGNVDRLPQHETPVLFAALEFELLSNVQMPDNVEKATKFFESTFTNRFGELIVDSRYLDRMAGSRRLHNHLQSEGYQVYGSAFSDHSEGAMWVVNYIKQDTNMPNIAFSLRVVYLPCTFSGEDCNTMVQDTHEDYVARYAIVNYENGMITSVDAHDWKTGQLVKRTTVTEVEAFAYGGYMDISLLDTHGASCIGRVGYVSRRVEEQLGGTRHSFKAVVENGHDENKFTYHEITIDHFDLVEEETTGL